MKWKKLVLVFISALLPALSFSQGKEITLKGFLGVQGGYSYTYKLVFTDSAGYLKGHAYTYLTEGKEVKAAITGFLDRANHVLSFKETNIVYNHGFESTTTICLITAALKLRKGLDGNEVYIGAISSADAGNVYCGEGTISIPANEEFKNLMAVAETPAQPVKTVAPPAPRKPMKIVYDTVSMAPPTREVKAPPVNNEPEKITAGTEKVIDWYSDTVVVEVWDGGILDGDNISVFYNGTVVLNKYTLAKGHKRITTLISPTGIDELTFLANHEGNQPPNTANVTLVDGQNRLELFVYNSIGQKAVIKLLKAKNKGQR